MITNKLADFASEAAFDKLPAEVVNYTKLVILDTVICGLAAGHMERSRMMHGVLQSMGGHEESSVFGTRQQYPAPLAAMANAEIMNCLDADDTFFASAHFAAINVAAALAEGQRIGCSGKDLILSMAVGFDINARLNLSSVSIRKNEKGQFDWSPIMGMGYAAFGSAVSSAVIRKLNKDQMRNMFGLAACMAPTPTCNTMTVRQQQPIMKYGNYQGAAYAGMLSSLLAQNGYLAEHTSLDNGGFQMAQGCLEADLDLLHEDLGKKWWITETSIKYYPSCRYTHGPIDMLRNLMAEENIAANEIEKIVIYMNPVGYSLKMFREPAQAIVPDHCAPLNGVFNIPYVMALAALGRTPGPGWYEPGNLEDSDVWRLASRITTQVDEDAKDEVDKALKQKIRRSRETPASIALFAKGREFRKAIKYVDGDPWTAQTKASWARVEEKFHNFCVLQVPEQKIEQLISQFKQLEHLPSIKASLDMNP